MVEGGAEHLVTRLRAGGPEGEAAARELHDLLVRAAMAYLARQGYSLEAFGADDPEALAEDFAQEALATILRQLHTFRGESRFTTWVYRIVINLIADEFLRRAWRRRPLPSEHEALPLRIDPADDPIAVAERDEVWGLIARVIQEELTPASGRCWWAASSRTNRWSCWRKSWARARTTSTSSCMTRASASSRLC